MIGKVWLHSSWEYKTWHPIWLHLGLNNSTVSCALYCGLITKYLFACQLPTNYHTRWLTNKICLKLLLWILSRNISCSLQCATLFKMISVTQRMRCFSTKTSISNKPFFIFWYIYVFTQWVLLQFDWTSISFRDWDDWRSLVFSISGAISNSTNLRIFAANLCQKSGNWQSSPMSDDYWLLLWPSSPLT